MSSALLFLGTAASWVVNLYVWATIVSDIWAMKGHRDTPAARIAAEVRVFVLVAVPLKMLFWTPFAEMSGFWTGVSYFADAYWFYHAYTHRDDRWQRRRQKAKEKVVELAGRLVVVPEPQPIPISVRRST